MQTSDFFYDLPKELIAQTPLEPRDSSRLMVLNRKDDSMEHRHFYDVLDYLHPGDALVLNNSRVIPARLYGKKVDTGGRVELLLLKQDPKEPNRWETLVKPGRRIRENTELIFGDGYLTGKIVTVKDDGNRIVEFSCEDDIYTALDKIGQMPLPPYITHKLANKERYQTVYSKDLGSAAAPTAGLHFTKELLQKAKDKGIEIAEITLHVGLGTFRPVKVEDITKHKMHSEHYFVPKEAADTIKRVKANGGRIISVGTTCCRTLESVMKTYGKMEECSGWTDIFIYPGFRFEAIDGLITNFHLPESTLIMLVSAFYGYDQTMRAYREAVKEKYRFFSFGDAMLIQ